MSAATINPTGTEPWMCDADGGLMPPALDLLVQLRLTDGQWRAWWAVWDTEASARTRGRGGVKLLRLAGDPNQPRWAEVVEAHRDRQARRGRPGHRPARRMDQVRWVPRLWILGRVPPS